MRFLYILLGSISLVAGIIGIPAAYEMTQKRFWLIFPVLLCLVCAACTEGISLWLERGVMYSALAGIIFAALQLLVVLPREKKTVIKE